jgi:hypothetical protein
MCRVAFWSCEGVHRPRGEAEWGGAEVRKGILLNTIKCKNTILTIVMFFLDLDF